MVTYHRDILLEVIHLPAHKRYAIWNKETQQIVTRGTSKPWLFRTRWGAERQIDKYDRSISRAIKRINKRKKVKK